MDQEYESASAVQTESAAATQTPAKTLEWRERLRAVRRSARAAFHRRVRWSAEDTLALIVTAAIILAIFLLLLRIW